MSNTIPTPDVVSQAEHDLGEMIAKQVLSENESAFRMYVTAYCALYGEDALQQHIQNL